VDLATWQARLTAMPCDKLLMNRLVLDFLVIEGYKDAAEAFSREAGVTPDVNLDSISDRMAIRASVQAGNIQAAVDRVNELDPGLLGRNEHLAFHLLQQQLIEIIRDGRVEDALLFAQQHLAPAGESSPAYLEDIERTMALLAFKDLASCPVADLLDVAQRHKTASELNGAILASQSQQREPKLPSVVRMLLWSQRQLAEKRVVFPRVSPDKIASGFLEVPMTNGVLPPGSSDLILPAPAVLQNQRGATGRAGGGATAGPHGLVRMSNNED